MLNADKAAQYDVSQNDVAQSSHSALDQYLFADTQTRSREELIDLADEFTSRLCFSENTMMAIQNESWKQNLLRCLTDQTQLLPRVMSIYNGSCEELLQLFGIHPPIPWKALCKQVSIGLTAWTDSIPLNDVKEIVFRACMDNYFHKNFSEHVSNRIFRALSDLAGSQYLHRSYHHQYNGNASSWSNLHPLVQAALSKTQELIILKSGYVSDQRGDQKPSIGQIVSQKSNVLEEEPIYGLDNKYISDGYKGS